MLRIRVFALVMGLMINVGLAGYAAPPKLKTQNVILFMTDGLRPEEVFTGAEADLMTKENGVSDTAALKQAYGQATPEARRQALFPFLWGVIGKDGQFFGNGEKGSPASVTNGLKFSYPGYNEVLTGYPDPRINSNEYGPNPNVTVLEWLNQKPEYHGKVAAFTSWDAFSRILNRERSGFFISAGSEPVTGTRISPRQELLNHLMAETPGIWGEVRYDSLTFYSALEYLKANKPRVLYISLDETDERGHEARYGDYLAAAHRYDAYVQTLWETLQSMPGYRGKTSLVVTTDHGRGHGLTGWRDHGGVEGAEKIWIGVIGPDTPALSERMQSGPVTQGQVAATLAALLGQDYLAAVPKAAPPLPGVLRSGNK